MAIAPDLEKEKEFIIQSDKSEKNEAPKKADKPAEPKKQETAGSNDVDEFDLSDISHQPKEQSREDIIAAAEAAAYDA